jgi:hypothetical protein
MARKQPLWSDSEALRALAHLQCYCICSYLAFLYRRPPTQQLDTNHFTSSADNNAPAHAVTAEISGLINQRA